MQKYGGWWDSIKTFLTQYNRPRPPSPTRKPTPQQPVPVQTQPVPVDRPQQTEDVFSTIHEAGRRMVLLQMRYNGNLRYVEPYSFRMKSTGQLFYGYCYKDHSIEAFRPEKIEYIALTEIGFAPRWPVEVGRS